MELTIKEISKSFGDVKALKDINLSFKPGVYGLLGPNGAGKSTLINLITNNLERDKGQIIWDGTDILKKSCEYRNILGYMPQQQGYYDDFTAGAFLMYIAHLKGLSKKEAKSRVEELLETFNLSNVRNKRVGSFSGGMKQRLLLAQAILNDPKLVILDEPTAGVDPQERINIRNYISQIATSRIVLLATHIVSDIEAIANEIVIIKAGEVIERDTPDNLIMKVQPHVWKVEVSQEELANWQKEFLVSNLRKKGQNIELKLISEIAPKGAVQEDDVNLEDVYLYYISAISV